MHRNRFSVILFTLAGAGLLLAILSIGISSSLAALPDKPVILGSEPRSVSQSRSMTALLVATSADYPPMEYISGTQIVGHDIDLMNAMAAEMTVTVVYTNVPFADIFNGLTSGKYDAVISAVSVTPEREQFLDFTLPYMTITDTGNIDNYAVAVQKGNITLVQEINTALRQLRANGTLQTIIAAVMADKPEWQPSLPDWPTIYLPLIQRN
jgi:ABC-type amino acid transport substrate-binding protein